jgi:hypothetical protein
MQKSSAAWLLLAVAISGPKSENSEINTSFL